MSNFIIQAVKQMQLVQNKSVLSSKWQLIKLKAPIGIFIFITLNVINVMFTTGMYGGSSLWCQSLQRISVFRVSGAEASQEMC